MLSDELSNYFQKAKKEVQGINQLKAIIGPYGYLFLKTVNKLYI